MALYIKEIMNPELFSVRATDTVEDALSGILAFQVSGAAVLDADGHPIGVVSIRDLLGGPGSTVFNRMSAPAVVIRESALISNAAHLIGETGYRRLVVVNEVGKAIGMVSAIDIVRALVGLPTPHPATFPRLDKAGVSWSSDLPFCQETLNAAPEKPGVLVLIYARRLYPERVVWAESSYNLRLRLLELLTQPQNEPELALWLKEKEHLRFRTATIADTSAREVTALSLRREARAPRQPSLSR